MRECDKKTEPCDTCNKKICVCCWYCEGTGGDLRDENPYSDVCVHCGGSGIERNERR